MLGGSDAAAVDNGSPGPSHPPPQLRPRSGSQGVAVVDPIFLSGPGAPHEARESISWLEEEAAAQGIEAEGLIRRGNPVRILIQLGNDVSLVVLGVDPHVRTPFRGLGIAGLIARGTAASVLLVPA